MNPVDRLGEIDAAASPGPWEYVADNEAGYSEIVFPDKDTTSLYGEDGQMPSMELAALSKLLLPAYRALEAQACPHQQWYTNKGVKHVTHEATCAEDKACRDLCSRCDALAQLEEALEM